MADRVSKGVYRLVFGRFHQIWLNKLFDLSNKRKADNRVVASGPPERRLTGAPNACANTKLESAIGYIFHNYSCVRHKSDFGSNGQKLN